MKVDFKIVCIALLALCLLAETEGWWSGSRSSSRSPSTSSRRRSSSSSSSRSWSSRRSSSSSSRRRGWFFRRPRRPNPIRRPASRTRRFRLWPFRRGSKATASPNLKPTKASSNTKYPIFNSCSLRFGVGCLRKKVTTKRPSGPTKTPTSCSYRTGICRKITKPKFRIGWPSGCSLRFGCIRPHLRSSRTTKAPTRARVTTAPTLKSSRGGAKKIGKVIKQGVKIAIAVATSSSLPSFLFKVLVIEYGKYLLNLACPNIGWLVEDIMGCKDKWRIPLPRPTNRNEVFAKKVVEMQIVERPMGHCGYKLSAPPTAPPTVYDVSKMYGERTIRCLHFLGVKTSISGKDDRVMHSGMVVKTAEDGKYYLIHKGKKFGAFFKRTIIEVANNMMYEKGYKNVSLPIAPEMLRSVEEYYRESGGRYDFMHDNCHDATLRMKTLANKP